MIDSLSIASSGLTANQAWIDSISNNVANMQTIGYKRSQVDFHDMVREVGTRDDGGGMTESLLTGAGIQASQPSQVFSPGTVRESGNALDLAIQGDGFFEVALPTGELAYTRAGRFHLDSEGQLAMPDGQTLTADLRVPPDARNLVIKQNGEVQATITETGEIISVGQVQLAKFASAEALTKLSDGLYRPTQASGEAIYAEPGRDGQGVLLQGYVEMSNVNLIDEMSGLVLAQRAYQMNARLLQASDQILETINNLRR
ncbi:MULTISPECIES: flagellar hook-basal body protein [Pseudomonas]|uniref:flagellar hook-basal body protein n=1 Tax=Pseudomonas TaxID=286 RepID=UPI0008599910|nr:MULTISPECIES: flagellar hook-basal body complex protein [Pseudomonas]AOS37982.1 flagellar biosynthesis protein FlgG [Pseudomonas brassicacearum]SCZ19725.1 flagellar basal-body rod protein FlgG [Pseudomonas sp. NFACC44-2]SDA45800.1 flagellar basal-body rod protein FlgG [Pseudomonas sp. NFACC51]SDB15596.1 flagellar basal-body rod protein FlgG [Pseudomonas sp. NFACC17-2]SEI44663.1 flagellar basal-body rod protein FlgG [Pseudomonas sp. NFACC07-1]